MRSPFTPTALSILRAEHRAVSAVLDTLRQTVRRLQDPQLVVPFEALRTLLFYTDYFPERLHHPKESEHLFTKLRVRTALRLLPAPLGLREETQP